MVSIPLEISGLNPTDRPLVAEARAVSRAVSRAFDAGRITGPSALSPIVIASDAACFASVTSDAAAFVTAGALDISFSAHCTMSDAAVENVILPSIRSERILKGWGLYNYTPIYRATLLDFPG
jgi:hypothetical protein